jgi:hypothetical protein
MFPIAQTLEPRRLFSATGQTLSADAAQLIAEAKSTRVVLTQERSAELADRKRVVADLRPFSRTNAKLVVRLERDEAVSWAKVFAAQTALVAKSAALSHRAVFDGAFLLRHPTSMPIQTRVAADAAALTAQIPLLLTALENQRIALDQALGADLTAIVNANAASASLPADVRAVNNDLGIGAAELGATSALVQIDVQTFVTDISSI